MSRLSHIKNATKLLYGFRSRQSIEVQELRLLAIELVHEKTGARYWHLERDDPNKTFSVQFRTTPTSNSGICHILEHTTLCGSNKYPVRDPFFKMLHRSQANFMNALTANDWTSYPFSTMNQTDFENLFQIYCDAVFRPKLNETDFMQEGWRLEPKSDVENTTQLHIKGIVYNEMKGVFSNALNRYAQCVQNKLLPKTYGYVSGGHPDDIPSLSWKDLKDFHAACYHPSNAMFFTYGDVELDWCLEHLDSEYLSHYDRLELHNFVELEPSWDAPRHLELTCGPDPMAADQDRQAVVSVSYRMDDLRSVYNNFVLDIVSTLLLAGDNAPMYRGLIETGYGLDWVPGVSGYDSSTRTTTLHFGVQGVHLGSVDEFAGRVRDLLAQVVRDGFPRERVEATLHQHELAFRHESARFGLNLILGMANPVNHDVDMSEALLINSLLTRFRKDFEEKPTMLQDMVQGYLLENPHQLFAVMRPEESWQQEQLKIDEERELRLVEKVGPEERDQWIQKAKQLAEKQQVEEDLSCLPCLQLYDIPMECRPEPFTMTVVDDSPVQLNEAPTNDIVYFHALVDLSGLPSELLAYVPLFCELFPRLGAGGLSYLEMDQAIDLHTGGLHVSPHVTLFGGGLAEGSSRKSLHLSGHCLQTKVDRFFDLWAKLFSSPVWTDRQRLTTLILMDAAGEWSANAMAGSAHRFAMRRASAHLSATRRTQELWSGLEQAALFKQMAGHLAPSTEQAEDGEQFMNGLVDRMLAIWRFVSNRSRFRYSLHGESGGLSASLPQLEQVFLPSLHNEEPVTAAQRDQDYSPGKPLSRSSYFVMPYTVHYTAQAMPAPVYADENYASYCLLSNLLTSKFLHREIREKGGAYGGRATVKPEVFALFSYRDPHARQTLEIYQKALEWAASNDVSSQDISEAKLAVFQELDQPVSAGSRGLLAFLTGIDDNLRQEHRVRVFAADESRVRTAARQLLDQPPEQVGRTVLGPSESTDWQAGDTADWDRVVVVE